MIIMGTLLAGMVSSQIHRNILIISKSFIVTACFPYIHNNIFMS
jgi:hypothetical protein